MVKILTFPVRVPGWILRGLYRLSHAQKTRGRVYPYYAFPAAIALLATFMIIRTVVGIWPSLGVEINGVHVHHFTWGILILAVSGFLALILQSGRAKYILAMSWGCGVAFIMDEFYPWLHLDDAAHLFERYDAVIYTAAILVLAILMPAVVDGLRRPRTDLKT